MFSSSNWRLRQKAPRTVNNVLLVVPTGVHILRNSFCWFLALRGAPGRSFGSSRVTKNSRSRSDTCTGLPQPWNTR